MSDMPETIWASRTIIFDDHTGTGSWLEYRHYPSAGEAHEYRRADLPPTLAQALKVPEVAAMVETLRWAFDTLYEINPSNYDHDEVCRQNDASVEVILGIKPALAAIEAAMKEATP